MNQLRIALHSSPIPVTLLAGFFCLVFASASFGLGSPRKLRDLSADESKVIEQAVPEKATAVPQKPRKILVFWLCTGFYHECIPVANKAIEIMGRKTGAFDVVTSDDMAMFDPDNLNQFDAVLFNNTTKLPFKDPVRKQALLDFVKNGRGVIGIHAATDNFYDWPEAAEMMGGLFSGHPWTSKGTWAVKIADPDHPLNAAFNKQNFKIIDEIYRIRKLNLEENCRVLLRLDLTDQATKNASGVKESDIDNPVSWIRNYGKGRVFYCGLGHNNEVYANPVVLRHYLDGIQYALGDLPADATPAEAKGEKPKTE